MKKKVCILQANCQGEPIENLLRLSREFSETYEIHRFTNYIREVIPDELLANCDIFIYQHLAEPWKEFSSANLCSKMKQGCKTIAFPSMLFIHYWPLWSGKKGFDYTDTFLESLIERDLSESQILHLFMNAKLTKIYDFESIIAKSEQIERAKESLCSAGYFDYILDNYKQKRLFNTINHPSAELLSRTANTILSELKWPEVTCDQIETFPEPFPEFEQPIHPQIAEYLGLEFAGPETRYNVYGASLTFEEYAIRYIKCRQMGIKDFISFLHATAKKTTPPS
ncbi:WcbI family polysaccharide biosynthesis putative acetyltransferase [Maridesulfovibrio frigidus]|uniref:WcbI family polysaccharide biosynthesis putative acetyltransferase n=1 Tax=Maridesulfovibrio frigidus TaxID=340956 RepID=UPI0004E1D30B|nr:WcbI family polysaccharide biosynthesis putative acetyltransferase [Maridesulfovibrio frigidus]